MAPVPRKWTGAVREAGRNVRRSRERVVIGVELTSASTGAVGRLVDVELDANTARWLAAALIEHAEAMVGRP